LALVPQAMQLRYLATLFDIAGERSSTIVFLVPIDLTDAADWRGIVGAVLIIAIWPFTLLGIMPTSSKLKAIALDTAGPTSRAWGRLYAVRTGLGIASTLAYLWALS
jgi:Anthrone oxygenase